MIDKLGWYLEPDEFDVKAHYLTGRRNVNDWKPNAKETYKNWYFPHIKPQGCSLMIHTCPAKILFGHNLKNVVPSDLDEFLERTIQQLDALGIEVSKETLRSKRLSILHVNQLVGIPLTIDCCTRMLQTAEKYGRLERGVSLYPENGICVFNNLSHRKLKIYDKTAEALKQPLAMEQAKELQKKHKTLLQVEFQMEYAREIEREYSLQKIKLENTLENAFNPIVARKILDARAREWLNHICIIDSPDYQLLETTEIICQNNNIHGIQARSSLLGCLWLCKQYGLYNALKYISRWTDHKTASKHCKKIKKLFLMFSEERDKSTLENAILAAIQNIGEESSPSWQCNTTSNSLSIETLSYKELKTC